jgi:hypothetical protein
LESKLSANFFKYYGNMAQQMISLSKSVISLPIATEKHKSIGIEEVQDIVGELEITVRPDITPLRPKGGEIYIFKSSGKITANDWRADGHVWSNNGVKRVPKNNPVLTKSYFILNLGKGITCKEFRKEAYLFPRANGSCVVLMHYLGDHTLSITRPHGNSARQTKIYIPTKPSVLHQLEQRVARQESHIVYKEAVSKVASIPITVDNNNNTPKSYLENIAEEYLDSTAPNINPVTDLPRNVKQVQNIRYRVTNDKRLSRDAIFNAHEIAYDDPSFTWKLQTVPDLVVIIGMTEMLQELQTVVQRGLHADQLLGYDTTFTLGDYYVSVLLFKHTLFEEKPVMAALYLIHERKFAAHHKMLFEVLDREVKHLKNVPIVTDSEAAITSAIESCTNLLHLGCHRHLRNDIKRWVDENGGGTEQKRAYVSDVQDLIMAPKYSEYTKLYNEFIEGWSDEFCQYFDVTLRERLDRYAKWSIGKKCPFDDDSGITNNICEGYNYLLKNLQTWREVPLDSLMLALKMLQTYHLNEIERAKAGLGNYTLAESCADLAINIENLSIKRIVTQNTL